MKLEHYGKGIAKGLSVTIKQITRHPTVVQYPEQRLNTSRRIRGNELVWSKDKCTGCDTCAKACPQGAIEIVTSTNLVQNRYEVEKYQVNTGYCIQCALCVEACPYGALYMSSAYEKAKYRRDELIQQKEEMMYESGKKKPSGYYYPDFANDMPKQTLLIEKVTEEE